MPAGPSLSARPLGNTPPRWPFTINWDNPDTHGLVRAWPLVWGPGFTDLVARKALSVNGGVTPKEMFGKHRVPQFDGSTGFLRINEAAVLAAPLTLSCWFNDDLDTSGDCLISLEPNSNSGIGFRLLAYGNIAGDKVTAEVAVPTSSRAPSADSFVAGVTAHGGAVFLSTTSRTGYKNGVGGTPETTSRSPAGIGRTLIGAQNANSLTNPTQGRIAFVEIYNVAKSADEMRRMFDPAFRWNRYYELGRRSWFLPSGAADQNLTATGFANANAFGGAQLDLNLAASGFANTQAFGAARLDLNLTASALVNVNAFGGPRFDLNLTPAGFANVPAFGAARLDLNLTAAGFADADGFGAPTVTQGQTLSASGFANGQAFGAARLDLNIAAAGFANANAYGSPTVTQGQTLLASGFANVNAFGALRIDLNLLATGFAGVNRFGAAAVSIEGDEEATLDPGQIVRIEGYRARLAVRIDGGPLLPVRVS